MRHNRWGWATAYKEIEDSALEHWAEEALKALEIENDEDTLPYQEVMFKE
ncbi:hypothetical protein MY04_4616 [Flammeovirga sp. MY04]|nr:hypothetical protein [Flammeovirga sp. MY04]ANQ51951.1 hypothetical protein MY04_4616 [Flammeovirga sp. MY04]